MQIARRSFLLVLLSACLVLPAQADLDSDVRAALRDKLLEKADVAVHIARLDARNPPTVLFRHNADKRLIPASNMKVLTTAAVLDHFGAERTFRTLLVQKGPDLVLIGDGDPTFGDAELLRQKKSAWKITTVYETWAEGLKTAGITSVRNIIVDDSIFDQTSHHPNWDPKQLHFRYCAPIGGMTLNIGCIDFIVQGSTPGKPVSFTTAPPTRYVTVRNTCITGRENAIILARQKDTNIIELKGVSPPHGESSVSVPLHDPALYAATVLAETLAAGGVKIEGQVLRDRTIRPQLKAGTMPADVRLVAMHETPLPVILTRTNKDSQNTYAEMICKRLGASVSGESGTWANGTAAIGAFLQKTGAAASDFQLDDGCGLSRENLVTTDIIVRALAYSFQGPNRELFISTLAVGGDDGTLDQRFRTGLKGRVFAKTGFINGVSGLSGYLKGRDEQWYAFSILMNGLPRFTNTKAKQLQEDIVQAIDNNSAPLRR